MMNARGINGNAIKLTLAQRKRACYCSEDDAVHYHCTKCNFAFESLRMVRPVNHDCDGPMSDDEYDFPRPTATNKTLLDYFSDDAFRHITNGDAKPRDGITDDINIVEDPKPHCNVVEVTEMKLGELKGKEENKMKAEDTKNLEQPKSVDPVKSKHDVVHKDQQHIKFGSFEPVKLEPVQRTIHNQCQFVKFGSFEPIKVEQNVPMLNNPIVNANIKKPIVEVVETKKNARFVKPINSTRVYRAIAQPKCTPSPTVERVASPNKQKKVWVKKETQKPPASVVDMEKSVQMTAVVKPIYKKPLYKRKNMRHAKALPESVTITLDSLCDELLSIVRERKLSLTIVGKNKHEFSSVELNGKMYYKVVTNHENGIINRLDMNNNEEAISLIKFFQARNPDDLIDEFDIRKGHSGLIINPDNIIGRRPITYRDDVMVVRGRLYGRIVDSLLRVHKRKVCDIEHYSSSNEIASEIFKGFERTFISIRDPVQHICTKNISLQECGEMCGILTQMVFPMWKITCGQCASLIEDRNQEQILNDASRAKVVEMYEQMTSTGKFKHVQTVINSLKTFEEATQEAVSIFGEIDALSFNKATSQLAQINAVAHSLIKGQVMSSTEQELALLNLKALTLWYKKRLESQNVGDLSIFRNKISAKTHINLALMCDNQLDVNGIFQWGERGYHAKRFFEKYFMRIDNGAQYEQFSVRKHIRGVRELAIRNLIVSTDIDKMVQSMKGSPATDIEIGEHCVSRLDKNFVYPCCCVTHDSGKVMKSEFKIPTKNHLVIGNSGDDKSIELPAREDGHMYIVKDGYCYILIFLAMMVNIREGDAKAFTKRVRDFVITKLGEWPSMRDLAVLCRYISAFYPEVSTAEIPKILVDHKHKTFHVMDSFGSKTTNYHILKANTVQQLCRFGDSDLIGEMKDYNVGGRNRLVSVRVDTPYGYKYITATLQDTEGHGSWNAIDGEIWDPNGSDPEADPLPMMHIQTGETGFTSAEDDYTESSSVASQQPMLEHPSDDHASLNTTSGSRLKRTLSIHTIQTDNESHHSYADGTNSDVEYARDMPTESDEDEECYYDDMSSDEESFSDAQEHSFRRDFEELSQFEQNVRRVSLGLGEQKDTCIDYFKALIKASFKRLDFKLMMIRDPYMILFALMTPTVMKRFLEDGSFTIAANIFLQQSDDLVYIATTLETLAQRISAHKVYLSQFQEMSCVAQDILSKHSVFQSTRSSSQARGMLEVLSSTSAMDIELHTRGYVVNTMNMQETKKKCYDAIYMELWQELSLSEKCAYEWEKLKCVRRSLKISSLKDLNVQRDSVKNCLRQCSKCIVSGVKAQASGFCSLIDRGKVRFVAVLSDFVTACFARVIKNITKYIQLTLLIALLLDVWKNLSSIIMEHKRLKLIEAEKLSKIKFRKIRALYDSLVAKLGQEPTREELLEYVSSIDSTLKDDLEAHEDQVFYQAKSRSETTLEQIVALCALMAMFFNTEKSDAVFKILSKVKSVFSSTDFPVQYQALDTPIDVNEFLGLTVNFDLTHGKELDLNSFDVSFENYWKKSLLNGHVCHHYRSHGLFLEFTRSTAESVCNTITQSDQREFLISGFVGSGKSTYMPSLLSSKGRVLIVEPTRPLTENVYNGLSGDPFFQSVTMCMRGANHYGSGNISVMTTGYALHSLANNRGNIEQYDYIMIDECHVLDANAMALYCLLKDVSYKGKILKTSATIPGRESGFKLSTQHDVTLNIEENLTFDAFVQAQGTGSNACVITKGDNILVYVSSYNEVDTLARKLAEHGHKVTKVDGRTMKLGGTRIETSGNATKKHFIVATNIIENGVTLDIDVVVDFGLKVGAVLDVDTRAIRYVKQPISHGERIQRLGRVGRIKKGHALRIGSTEKGIPDIPACIATEAAFLCFIYGLPLIAQSVVVSALGKCTSRQARTMAAFELSPFYMKDLVKYDGSMHKQIHSALKSYILRDTEIQLKDSAIPHASTKDWLTVREYNQIGSNIHCEDNVKIPFMVNGIPESVHEKVWKACLDNAHSVRLNPLNSACAQRISYTLSSDSSSILRTIGIIEELIKEEKQKSMQFQNLRNTPVGPNSFNPTYLTNMLKSKYLVDHSEENLETLYKARSQLIEFNTNYNPDMSVDTIRDYPYTAMVNYQSSNDIAQALQLKGKYDMRKISTDIIVSSVILFGGAWMAYDTFKHLMSSKVTYQAKNKCQIQKLRFRDSRDKKLNYAVANDDSTIEHYFGSAYTKKGKTKGTVHGMGRKMNKFYTMYGVDPTEYSIIRYVDPITGNTCDDSATEYSPKGIEELNAMRVEMVEDDAIDLQQFHRADAQTYVAYYIKHGSDKALKIDLTPHNPLMVCHHTASIAGFPEKEGFLRRTGPAVEVNISEVPKPHSYEYKDSVSFEAKSTCCGPRNYNAISSVICHLELKSDGNERRTFGIGYGPYIIANQHLFTRNNGTLKIKSQHGEFIIKNTCQLQLKPIDGIDVVLIKLPKDHPPFSSKLKFREPEEREKVCLVSVEFNPSITSALMSETSFTYNEAHTRFWKHWITTKEGHCGLPIVSTKDGYVLGIHSLSDQKNSVNYFTTFPNNFQETYLAPTNVIDWVKGWKHNTDNIAWGSLKIQEDAPEALFKTTKLISDLINSVTFQSSEHTWLTKHLNNNLKVVGCCPGALITKHIVKGRCPMFQLYLTTSDDAKQFFQPLLGHYGKSMLNKQAYVKDFTKYSSVIETGSVDTDVFEAAISDVIDILKKGGMDQCNYVTDTMEIINSLNMKAAVGALYGGKKKDYFADYQESDYDRILEASCKRLYLGKMGVWNGSLKAEIRSVEKIALNKTRSFTAAPIETLLGGKVCVDDFNNKFYSCNLSIPSTVGITKFYRGWHNMLTALPDNWIYCDADGSRFDSSLTPYLLNAVLSVRLEFMEPWDVGEQMLSNLYTEIIYTAIATPDGSVIKKFKGNNSGQPSTVVDNTIMVMLSVQYALRKCGIAIDKQTEVIKYFCNGDDLLIAIHPDYENILDKFQQYFHELGLDYDFSNRSKSKEDVYFMSHRGLLRDGIYIPKLDKERVVSILEWDRADKPEHRLEAICASMIEAWGYPDLLHEIRKFYQWLLEQAPYNVIAQSGKAPYIAETALKKLFTNIDASEVELERYYEVYMDLENEEATPKEVRYQAGEGEDAAAQSSTSQQVAKQKDKDVDTGTTGKFAIPRIKALSDKMRFPRVGKTVVLNAEHLLAYRPEQIELYNTRSTKQQFENWYNAIKKEYDVNDEQMRILLNGLMVWCIENGTSPNLSGNWTMMDGDDQVEYPLAPIVDNAKPTFRQIMAHFSDAAEAYIEYRNATEKYMPRYGLQRNLTELSLARYAFDFYEMTSKTPKRAKEAHMQMKAAAVRGATNRMFGLDGNVNTTEEDTERHTAADVNKNQHTLLGIKM
uniref:Genome polyprotein n=1 Tax=Onion yellow dwarf virus TaxID=43130 RepID=Q18PE2_9POTV|nr:polyprotein [Onion yellow dwarf virus]